MGLFGDIFAQAKDAGSSAVAEKVLRKQIADYGDVQDIVIDSRNKKIALKVMLKGESAPLSVLIDQYEVQSRDEKLSVIIRKISVNREWLNLVLRDHVVGRSFPIPEKYASVVRMVL